MGRVQGKVAIITGAARGMGAAHARLLAEEGAKVVLTDILEKEGRAVAEEIGSNALFIPHDVSREDDWQRVVAETEAAFGPVSVLINNAAITSFGYLESTELADYMHTIDINQVSIFLGMKSVVASMRKNKGGSIVNVSSVAGMLGFPNSFAYTAAKFAVRGMTKAGAVELAPDNIRVNCVLPGGVKTEMAKIDADSEAALAAAAERTLAKRFAEPEEVSAVMLMFASDESPFMTGTEIIIDGGLTSSV